MFYRSLLLILTQGCDILQRRGASAQQRQTTGGNKTFVHTWGQHRNHCTTKSNDYQTPAVWSEAQPCNNYFSQLKSLPTATSCSKLEKLPSYQTNRQGVASTNKRPINTTKDCWLSLGTKSSWHERARTKSILNSVNSCRLKTTWHCFAFNFKPAKLLSLPQHDSTQFRTDTTHICHTKKVKVFCYRADILKKCRGKSGYQNWVHLQVSIFRFKILFFKIHFNCIDRLQCLKLNESFLSNNVILRPVDEEMFSYSFGDFRSCINTYFNLDIWNTNFLMIPQWNTGNLHIRFVSLLQARKRTVAVSPKLLWKMLHSTEVNDSGWQE